MIFYFLFEWRTGFFGHVRIYYSVEQTGKKFIEPENKNTDDRDVENHSVRLG